MSCHGHAQIQRQRVKHLQYEHHGAEAALRADALAATHRQCTTVMCNAGQILI